MDCSRLNVHCTVTHNCRDLEPFLKTLLILFFCSYTCWPGFFGVTDYVTVLMRDAGPYTPLREDRVSEMFLERLLGSSWLKQTVNSAMLWGWIYLHWAVSVLSDELKLNHYHKSFLWYVWDMTIWFYRVVHIGIKFQRKVGVLKWEHFIYLLGHYYYMCYYCATRFLKWKFFRLKTTFSV